MDMATQDHDQETILEFRKHCRYQLDFIKDRICLLQTDHIDAHHAENAGIQHRSMYLETQAKPPYLFDSVKEEECWFPPDEEDSEYPTYNPESEDRLNTMGLQYYLDSYLGGAWPADENKLPNFVHKERSDLRLKGLYELPSVHDHSWRASLTYVARSAEESKPSPPHFKCLVSSEVAGDERLLRGELITIINSMINRLSFKSTLPHTVAPVMLYSLMYPQQLRVLEAYFDGENLVVSSTKLYDMRNEDTESLKWFLRWWLGPPVGDTKSIPVSC